MYEFTLTLAGMTGDEFIKKINLEEVSPRNATLITGSDECGRTSAQHIRWLNAQYTEQMKA